jgi:hypothetical protein
MKTRSSDNWASKPGNFDAGTNTSVYLAATTKLGYPIIYKDDTIEPPRALLRYNSKLVRRSTDATHFFTDDYRFATVWNRPNTVVKTMAKRTTLSPDFSMYRDHPLPVQQWNHYRKQWCGSFWQYYGAKVIPAVGWSDELSFDFCFDGVQQGSLVALSVVGLRRYPKTFTAGFDKMIEVVKPRGIICLGDITRVYRGENSLDNVTQYKYVNQRDRYYMVKDDV